MAQWLLKTEPGTYSYADLERDGRTTWDGVSNNLALKHLRSMVKGDLALIYHTGSEKAIVGVAEAVSNPFSDPREARLTVIDLKPRERLKKPVSLAEIRKRSEFRDFLLVRLPRLSVMPVDAAQWKTLLAMSR